MPPVSAPASEVAQTRSDRWRQVNLLRNDLIAQALGRGLTREEAEDVASECILRAGSKEDLDLERAPNWLRRVAHNMVVDTYRERVGPRQLHRLAASAHVAYEPQTAVDDRLEAAWVSDLVRTLPPRQRRVLQERADGRSIEEIARDLDTTYKTVESLASRARTTIRHAIAAIAAFFPAAARLRRNSAIGGGAALAFACAVMPALPGAQSGARAPHPARTQPHVVADVESTSLPLDRVHAATTVRLGWSRPGTSSTSSTSTLLPGGQVGPVRHGSVSVTRVQPNRSFTQSVEDCLAAGIEVSSDNVGCAGNNDAERAD